MPRIQIICPFAPLILISHKRFTVRKYFIRLLSFRFKIIIDDCQLHCKIVNQPSPKPHFAQIIFQCLTFWHSVFYHDLRFAAWLLWYWCFQYWNWKIHGINFFTTKSAFPFQQRIIIQNIQKHLKVVSFCFISHISLKRIEARKFHQKGFHIHAI